MRVFYFDIAIIDLNDLRDKFSGVDFLKAFLVILGRLFVHTFFNLAILHKLNKYL